MLNAYDLPSVLKIRSDKVFNDMGRYFERKDLISLLALLGATMLLLFIGIKDDLIAISPKKKLVFQLIAAGAVILVTDVRIHSFNGLLGIWELPYIASVLFTFFVFILVTNAFNLIDGIDGLAGFISLIGFCYFGLFFLQNEQELMFLVAFTLIGSTLGFLRYNLSKQDSRKLFMGDSGSMFIGYLLAYQGVTFLSAHEGIPYPTSNAPIMVLCILSFTLLDTLRVFGIRMLEKRSPFSPDRNHIHHRLIYLGLSHKEATVYIAFCNWLLIGVAFSVQMLNINLQLIICISIGLLLYLSPFSNQIGNLICYISNKISRSKTNEVRPNTNIETKKSNVISQKDNSVLTFEVVEDEEPKIEAKKEKEFRKIIEQRISILEKHTYQNNPSQQSME